MVEQYVFGRRRMFRGKMWTKSSKNASADCVLTMSTLKQVSEASQGSKTSFLKVRSIRSPSIQSPTVTSNDGSSATKRWAARTNSPKLIAYFGVRRACEETNKEPLVVASKIDSLPGIVTRTSSAGFVGWMAPISCRSAQYNGWVPGLKDSAPMSTGTSSSSSHTRSVDALPPRVGRASKRSIVQSGSQK